MNDEFMFKLAQIRGSYTRKKFGTINNEEKALIDYETFCLELIKEIEKLQQENNQLKEKCEKQQYAITENCDLRLEIEQLKENNQAMQEEICRTWEKLNIIKELRSWLEKKLASDNYADGVYYGFKSCLLKLNKLEGDKNE